MNENETTQPHTIPAAPAVSKRPVWRRKPVWITAIVVGSLALGGAGAAFAIDEFDADDDRSSVSQPGVDSSSSGVRDDADDRESATDSDARDADDVPLTEAELADASAAALAEAGGGTVTDVDRSDDVDHRYEVDVLLANGDELEVELDDAFTVVRTELDPRD